MSFLVVINREHKTQLSLDCCEAELLGACGWWLYGKDGRIERSGVDFSMFFDFASLVTIGTDSALAWKKLGTGLDDRLLIYMIVTP